MFKQNRFAIIFVFPAVFIFAFCDPTRGTTEVTGSSNYNNLVSLFNEFRELQKPEGIDVNHETLAIDLINEIGPIPGNYLSTKHTRKWWKKGLISDEEWTVYMKALESVD